MPALDRAVAARLIDAATGQPLRTVRLGKNHAPLSSIAKALEADFPGTMAAYRFGHGVLVDLFSTTTRLVTGPEGTAMPAQTLLRTFRVEPVL